MLKKLAELELPGKTVFVRVDFNVPIASGKIGETHRIDSALPTIEFILRAAKKLVIASQLGRPDGKIVSKYSMAPVRDYLARALGRPVVLAPDCVGDEVSRLLADDKQPLVLLENLRFHAQEEKNDPEFSKQLAALCEVYVNDAFGTAHRAHASTVGMIQYVKEAGAGLLMNKELEYLNKVTRNPERPCVAILGGAKVSDKIEVIQNLMKVVDQLMIGGAMGATIAHILPPVSQGAWALVGMSSILAAAIGAPLTSAMLAAFSADSFWERRSKTDCWASCTRCVSELRAAFFSSSDLVRTSSEERRVSAASRKAATRLSRSASAVLSRPNWWPLWASARWRRRKLRRL